MSRPLRVVVVDDEPAVARLHTRLIGARADCDVVATVGTGPAAVAAITEHEPDLVLLDIYLPGYSGLEVLRHVRASHQHQPEFIAVTAARDFASVREARLTGVRHYLVKPFSVQALEARVSDVVAELADVPELELDQREIDTMIGAGSASTDGVAKTAGLPKGLSVETMDAVRHALAEAPWSSASELGERVGISRVSARRYLEHLAGAGLAERRLDYATSGRPGSRYALT